MSTKSPRRMLPLYARNLPGRLFAAQSARCRMAIGVGCAALLGLPTRLDAQQTLPEPTTATGVQAPPLRLVRCFHTADLGCFRVLADVKEPETADKQRLRARLDASELVGPGEIRSDFEQGGPINLLIVYDVSGSMNGEGMAYTRGPINGFIQGLPRNVSTAVVPFGSMGVKAAFERARFEPTKAAQQQLQRIPSPNPKANTALYSAIENGLLTLDKQTRPGARSIMLVITDGVNDVRKDSDPGLLADETGLEIARQAIANTRHNVWLVGAGIVDSGMTKMRILAGNTAQANFTEMDPGKLKELLDRIRSEMTPTRLMAYAIPAGARFDLGRRRRQFRLAALTDSVLTWRPPLVALPPYHGDADSTLLLNPPVLELARTLKNPLTERLVIGLPLLLLLVVAHWVLPRVIGVPEKATVVGGASASAEADPTADAIKSDPKTDSTRLQAVTEAPPRKPGDITKDMAV